jgi:hypothetical protein
VLFNRQSQEKKSYEVVRCRDADHNIKVSRDDVVIMMVKFYPCPEELLLYGFLHAATWPDVRLEQPKAYG